ncbi:oxidoreductase isoform X2 [Tasmannia lanceolata]
MPHQDGPAYFPVVAILSLGSSAVMDFTPHSRLRGCTNKVGNSTEDSISDNGAVETKTDELSKEVTGRLKIDHYPFSVLLMPCSLLIFKDAAYSDYLHGIEDTEVQSLENAANVMEVLKHREQNSSLSSAEAIETEGIEQHSSIHRTTTRVSLTCRLVSKVHKKLFKF